MATKPAKGLLEQTVNASTWVIAGRFLSRILDFVTLLVLARLLNAPDFGLIAMAVSVVALTDAVLELPLTQALVRVEDPTPSMFDTAFTLSVLRAIVLALILALVSWPAMIFYDEPRLPALICVIAIAPILRSTVSPRLVVYMRAMDFRREFVLDIAGRAVCLVVSVIIAYFTRSYWALAVASVCAPITMNILSYRMAPYRPRLSLKEWKSFSHMMSWFSASQLLASVNWQIDRLTLGRYAPQSTLGTYVVASDLAAVPMQSIFGPLARPLNASFARHRGDLGAAFSKASSAISLILAPAFVSLAMLSHQIIEICFGPGWLAAAPVLFWIAIIGLIDIPAVLVGPMAMAQNATHYVAARTVSESIAKIPAVIVGVMAFGVDGALGGRAIGAIVSLMASVLIIQRLCGLSFFQQVGALWRTIVACCALAACLYLLRPEIVEQCTQFGTALQTAVAAVAGGIVYCATVFALWIMCDRPHGIESMACDKTKDMIALLKLRQQSP